MGWLFAGGWLFARFWHKTLGFASEAASGGSKSWKIRVPGIKPWAPLRRLPPAGQNLGKLGFLGQNLSVVASHGKDFQVGQNRHGHMLGQQGPIEPVAWLFASGLVVRQGAG